MDNDAFFHFAFVVMFLCAAMARGIGWYAAAKARRERLHRHAEHGLALFAAHIIVGQGALLIALAASVQPVWAEQFAVNLPAELRWWGLALAVAGVGTLLWAQVALSITVTSMRDVILADTNRLMVLSGGLLAAGFVFLAANWLLALLGVVMTLSLVTAKSPVDEPPTLMERVLRWMPKPRS